MSGKKKRGAKKVDRTAMRKEHGRKWRSKLKAQARKKYRKDRKSRVEIGGAGGAEEMVKLSLLAKGSINERYVTCGKSDCPCMKKGGKRHGPYYYYTLSLPTDMVKAGHPRNKQFYVTKEEAEELRRRIENYKKLKRMMWEELWHEFSEVGSDIE